MPAISPRLANGAVSVASVSFNTADCFSPYRLRGLQRLACLPRDRQRFLHRHWPPQRISHPQIHHNRVAFQAIELIAAMFL